MTINRIEILYKHYLNQIQKDWKWNNIRQSALKNCFVEEDQIIASCYVGSVMSIYPSGKYYMPWCSNQTKHDVIRDTAFSEALEEAVEAHGMFITSGEGDATDLYLQFVVEKSEVISYITQDNAELAEELEG